MARYCGKCGSELDSKGKCPNCDVVAFEANAKKSSKSGKHRAIGAVIALILVIAIIVSSVIFAVSKGWIGNKKEDERKKIQTTYVTYLNKTIIPEIGEYDSEHPETSNEGVHSALFCDLNSDGTDEFVVAYSKKSGDNIDFNISCYEYKDEKSTSENEENNVELIGTVNPSSEPDYVENDIDVFHLSNETIVYAITYKDVTYIVCEHMSWLDVWSYECHIYKIDEGSFVEESNIFVPDIGTDGTRIVYSDMLPNGISIDNSDFGADLPYEEAPNQSRKVLYYAETGGYIYAYDKYYDSEEAAVADFFKCYGIINDNYHTEENGHVSIYHPDKSNLIYSYCYYCQYDSDGNISEKYEINDYTDWKSLLDNDDVNESTDPTDEEYSLTEEDIKLFEDMLQNTSWVWEINEELDVNNITLEELIDKYILVEAVPCGMYTNFWEIPESDYIIKDPKNKYIGCYKLNADNVDWIIKNVFGLTPDRSIANDIFYYDGDSLYRNGELGGGPGSDYEVIDAVILNNKKVGFTAHGIEAVEDGADWYQYFVAELKNDTVMGKYWAIYALSNDSSIFEKYGSNSTKSENISINASPNV